MDKDVLLSGFIMCIKNYLLLLVFGGLLLSACESEELFTDEINDPEQKTAEYTLDLLEEQSQWFNYLCSKDLNGRYSGSDGIKKAADYITNVINDSSLMRTTFEGEGVMMENLIYSVKGYSDSTIVLGAHYDAFGFRNKNPLPGADDNASGVAVLLTIIKIIKSKSIVPPYSLTFCFFDGEEIGRCGSRRFVRDNIIPIKLYINVDTCGSENDYDLTVSYNSSFPKLREKYVSLPNKIGALPIMEYAPLGYTTDCEFFGNSKIPFIAIGPYEVPFYLHSPNDDISHISFSRINTISRELVNLLFN